MSNDFYEFLKLIQPKLSIEESVHPPDPDYSDKAPEVKSTFVLQQEALAKKAQEKKTKSTKES